MKNLNIKDVNAISGGCWPFCCCKKQTVYVSDYCKNAKIIYVSKNDLLTDETTRAIYEHNELYEKLCLGEGKIIL